MKKKIWLTLSLVFLGFIFMKLYQTYLVRNKKCIISSYKLDVNPKMQIHNKLCWGACIEMVLDYKLKPTKSNFQKTYFLSKCPRSPLSPCTMNLCNDISGNSLIYNLGILDVLVALNASRSLPRIQQASPVSLTFNLIVQEISNDRPIIALVNRAFNSGFSGHYVVITGFDCSTQYIEYIDPWASDCTGCKMQTSFENFNNTSRNDFIGKASSNYNAIINIF